LSVPISGASAAAASFAAAGGEVASAATAVAGAPAPTGAGPLKKKLEIDRCAMAICLPSPWAPSAAKRHVHHVCQL